MARLRNYRVKIAAGEDAVLTVGASVIRLTDASVPIYFKDNTGLLDFYLIKGEVARSEKVIFDRVVVSHKEVTDQYVTLTFGDDANIVSSSVSGAVSITNAIDLSPSTLAALGSVDVNAIVYGASYRSITNLAANTSEVIFSPAANVNGAVIHSAQFFDLNATNWSSCVYLAKASAPASVVDGDGILSADSGVVLSGNVGSIGSLKNPLKIAAGKGLYFISGLAATVSSRSVLYTLL